MPAASAAPSKLLASAALSVLLAFALVGCAAGSPAERPPWVDGRFSAEDQRADLLGVGSAPGRGPEAAETARQRALAALLQQLSTHVHSETTSRELETLEQVLRGGRVSESGQALSERERLLTVSTAGQLQGVRFELAAASVDGADVTWSLARLNRELLAGELAREIGDALDAARRQLDSAAAALGTPGALSPPGALADHATAGQVADSGSATAVDPVPTGLVAALAGEAALEAPRARLPFLPAAAGGSTPTHRRLVAELDTQAERARILTADIARRLELRLDGPPPRVRLSGQLDALTLLARWDGRPLAALPMAAQLGGTGAVHGLTDSTGRVALQLPQGDGPPGPLRVGVTHNGGLGPISTLLPVAVPAAASARVAVFTRHQRHDGAGAWPLHEPPTSPLQAPLEAALGALHFLVVPPGVATPAGSLTGWDGMAAGPVPSELREQLAGHADYVLVVTSTSAFRSREGRQQQGVLWYGTALHARFVELASGESFSAVVSETDSRDAGASAEQAGQRSLDRALARLLDPQRTESLSALLRARFR